jgi:methylated-DNA-protein-cysteine methyltransferase-like protein
VTKKVKKDGTKRGAARGSPVFGRVHALVNEIPRGRVATYGQLSRLIGGRLSPVGIGWALHTGGDEVVAWHRVINSRGGISTEGESPGLQRDLLESEGVKFRPDGTVDLALYQWEPRRTPRRRGAKSGPARGRVKLGR